MDDSAVSTLARILEYSAHTTGVEAAPGHAQSAVRQAAADTENAPRAEILARAAEELGLAVRVVRRPVSEALAQAHEQAIWIALHANAAVVKAGSRSVRVVKFGTEIESASWSRSELLKAVGARSESDPVEWIVVESAKPLTQHADEGHGDHHHHGVEHHGISPWKRLRLLLTAERHDMWVAVIYSAAIGLLTLVVPITTQSLVNTVAFGTVLQPLVVLTAAVLIALGFAALLQCLRSWVVELIQQRVFVRVATDVVYKLIRVQAQAFDKHHGPELVNRFLEVVTVQKAGATLLVDGLSITMQTIIGMALLAVYHPWLLAFDAFLLLAIVVVLFGMARGAVRTSIRESRAKYSLVAWLEEIARHIVTFKSSYGSAYALDKTDQLVGQYITERNKHFRILLRQIAGSLTLQAVASAVLLGVGGWLVIDRQLTLGQLIAAEIVVGALVSGFSKFGKQLETFYDLQASLDKLGYLTDLPLERSGTQALRRTAEGASVEMRGIRYGFAAKKGLLSALNWRIPANARVGFTGKGGQGKSTVLDMLYGLREPLEGVIEIDGRDYRDLKLGDLRAQAMLIRENEIFEGTVADNVRLGNFRVTTDEIRDALRRAGVLNAVLELPHGIQTRLQTGGLPLSPSQSMRVMMARALVMKPRLLLIDEALDSIDDFRIGGTLHTALFDPSAPWTLVVATENRQVLDGCDEWYTIRNGALHPGEPSKVPAGN